MGLDSHTIGILFAMIAALAWAVFTFTMKMALRGASVMKTAASLNGLNAILVTAIALTIVPPAEFIPKTAESAFYLVLAGIFHIGMARLVFYTAIQRLGPNRALPIALSYPIVTAVSAALMLGERPTPQILAGLIVLLGGITLIVRAEPGKAEPGEPATPAWRMTGWACAAAAAFLWGIAAIFFKKAAMEMHPLAVSALALWIGFAAVWLAAKWLDPDGVVPSRSWRWIALSACCQTVAVPLYTLAFTYTLAVRVSTIASTQPLFVIPLGWLFMREAENITPRLIAGAALVVGGTILVVV